MDYARNPEEACQNHAYQELAVKQPLTQEHAQRREHDAEDVRTEGNAFEVEAVDHGSDESQPENQVDDEFEPDSVRPNDLNRWEKQAEDDA